MHVICKKWTDIQNQTFCWSCSNSCCGSSWPISWQKFACTTLISTGLSRFPLEVWTPDWDWAQPTRPQGAWREGTQYLLPSLFWGVLSFYLLYNCHWICCQIPLCHFLKFLVDFLHLQVFKHSQTIIGPFSFSPVIKNKTSFHQAP